MKLTLIFFAIATLASTLQAQSDSGVAFEAASIKPVEVPADAGNPRAGTRFILFQMEKHEGGPGTMDPGRIHYVQPLQPLIAEAFEVPFRQVRGPEWMMESLFEVDAVMPANTSLHNAHLMLRNLLIERFRIQYHVGTTLVDGFALVVEKNGPRISPTMDRRAPSTVPIRFNAKGQAMPQFIGKPGIRNTVDNRGWSVAFEQQTMRQFATYLAELYRAPVADLTGMTGEYDFTLQFYPPGWGPTRETSTGVKYFPLLGTGIRRNLGLRLKRMKQAGPFVAIDHAEQAPIEN